MSYGKILLLADFPLKSIEKLQNAKLYLNNTVIEISLGDSYKRIVNFKEAEQAYQNAANMIPSRFYPNYLLAKLYLENGDSTKAIARARKILEMEVKVPSTAVSEMKVEMERLIKRN